MGGTYYISPKYRSVEHPEKNILLLKADNDGE